MNIDPAAEAALYEGRSARAFISADEELQLLLYGDCFPKEFLTFRSMIISSLSERRARHVLSVVGQAAALAELYRHEDPAADHPGFLHQVRTAAILHDCAKELPPEQCLALSDDEVPVFSEVTHAFAGAVYAREHYGVSDEAVLQAIRLHTTGDVNMTLLDRIIYLADCTEPLRNYPGVERYREALPLGSYTVMQMVLEHTLSYLKEKGTAVHPASERAFYYFVSLNRDSKSTTTDDKLQ